MRAYRRPGGRAQVDLLAAEPTVPEKQAAPHLPPGPGAVRFEGVGFGYAPDTLPSLGRAALGGQVTAGIGYAGRANKKP